MNDEETVEAVIKRKKGKAEKWRLAKKLGSLLGDYEDVKRREQLLIIAQASANKLWMNKKSKYSNETKVLQINCKACANIQFCNTGTHKKLKEKS